MTSFKYKKEEKGLFPSFVPFHLGQWMQHFFACAVSPQRPTPHRVLAIVVVAGHWNTSTLPSSIWWVSFFLVIWFK